MMAKPASVYLLMSEVIALTEELLATAKQNEISLSDAGATSDSPNNLLEGAWRQMESRNDPIHEGKFPIGTKVQAVFSEDGEWYEATVEAHTLNGYYVSYNEWGNKEEVDPDNVRAIENNALLEAERLAEATKNALKRKIEQAASSDYQSKTLPAKLKIDPNDPEDVKIAKRKKIHAFKSKARQEQLEVAQNKKQNAWQQFQTTKAKTKKVGFYTGRKKESIFKSPEDPFGKVGVIGSGKGLTDFQKREKHLHLKSGNAEGTDE
ncbi:survival of motor neuron-related-splicing factor 30 isoform X6 [Brassica rapa]|uniref:survival of motor neuron-related-splicing factor 30 isoform X6 n=1 Tax=Brassica campestris TaxID=3711 RepID=UPI0004F16B0C|nr:survival of motor neuron-related-splicing factor 30 isoform X6 [Brassica rapa]XP_018511886.1 survival of motor neuron-related-splicing factor 30 isoform X6 [Brassica rapa]XP_033139870.1 survival of motor neuron-related-splicing factor 30 isoform X6 [Brassica rapa]XP_033139871.1 survival of motor neuron-related-splicing factor 30 isoform X6 [Brassica rapa]